MKSLIFISLFIIASGFAKGQCIFVYASEKVKGVEIPIERVEFEITVNDTIKKKYTSKNDGSLGRISLERGKYKVRVVTEEFTEGVADDVVVNESRTTNLIVNMVRLSPAQIEEKKKGKK